MKQSNKTMKRLPYTLCLLGYLISLFLGNIVSGVTDRTLHTYTNTGVIAVILGINLLFIIIMGLFAYICGTRRLRDCGMNPYLAWLIILPIANPFFFIYLCFPKSKKSQ